MPPLSWINANKRILEGVELINLLSTTQFNLLLKRADESDGNDVVNKEEYKKLCELLKLKESDVNLLLQSLIHIWRQSTKVILKPTDLKQNLNEILLLNSEKSDEFVKLWTEKTKSNFEDLAKRKKLDSIAWEIDLEAASSHNAKGLIPKVRLQLSLKKFADNSKCENVTLELSEGELLELYSKIEKVQAKLDSIQNISTQN